MKFLFALMLALAVSVQATTVPTVTIPPTTIEREFYFFVPQPDTLFNADLEFMLTHAEEVFEILHDMDTLPCGNGPTDPAADPAVNRCDGVI